MIGNTDINSYGAGGGWGGLGGGIGGFGLVGLIGLLNNRNGLLGGGDGSGCGAETALLAAISSAKDATVGEGRSLAAAICASDNITQQGFFASALANNTNTQSIKDQMTAFQIANDSKFEGLSRQIAADGDATRALITQNEIQNLRDQLHIERRRGDHRDIEISIQNSNAQAQLQAQAQGNILHNRLDALISQNAKTNQDIINLGTMVASGTQAAPSTNINSK